MMRLFISGLLMTLCSLALSAPVDNTTQHKGIVFPKKTKENVTVKMEEQKNVNQKAAPSSTMKNTGTAGDSSKNTSLLTYIPLTVDNEFAQSINIVSTEQMGETTLMPLMPEPDDSKKGQISIPDESSPLYGESREVLPSLPLPEDTTDGLIEYNLGNPLALRLHLPWWPLKDMLKSIQDAISLMNLTLSRDTLETDTTKTKIVRFDDRNYTLKVKVLKPSENNRLLVRLISLTPVIEDGKIPMDKDVKIEEGKRNEALDESAKKIFAQMKQEGDEEAGEEKKDDGDGDGDDDNEKEEKSTNKYAKKEEQDKKKKEEKDRSDTEDDSD